MSLEPLQVMPWKDMGERVNLAHGSASILSTDGSRLALLAQPDLPELHRTIDARRGAPPDNPPRERKHDQENPKHAPGCNDHQLVACVDLIACLAQQDELAGCMHCDDAKGGGELDSAVVVDIERGVSCDTHGLPGQRYRRWAFHLRVVAAEVRPCCPYVPASNGVPGIDPCAAGIDRPGLLEADAADCERTQQLKWSGSAAQLDTRVEPTVATAGPSQHRHHDLRLYHQRHADLGFSAIHGGREKKRARANGAPTRRRVRQVDPNLSLGLQREGGRRKRQTS